MQQRMGFNDEISLTQMLQLSIFIRNECNTLANN